MAYWPCNILPKQDIDFLRYIGVPGGVWCRNVTDRFLEIKPDIILYGWEYRRREDVTSPILRKLCHLMVRDYPGKWHAIDLHWIVNSWATIDGPLPVFNHGGDDEH